MQPEMSTPPCLLFQLLGLSSPCNAKEIQSRQVKLARKRELNGRASPEDQQMSILLDAASSPAATRAYETGGFSAAQSILRKELEAETEEFSRDQKRKKKTSSSVSSSETMKIRAAKIVAEMGRGRVMCTDSSSSQSKLNAQITAQTNEGEKSRLESESNHSLQQWKIQLEIQFEYEKAKLKSSYASRMESLTKEEEESSRISLEQERDRFQRLREAQLQIVIQQEAGLTSAVIEAENSRLQSERQQSLLKLKLQVDKEIQSEISKIKSTHASRMESLTKEEEETSRISLGQELERLQRLRAEQLQLLTEKEAKVTTTKLEAEKGRLASELQINLQNLSNTMQKELEKERAFIESEHAARLESLRKEEEESHTLAYEQELERLRLLRAARIQLLKDTESKTTTEEIEAEKSRIASERQHLLKEMKIKTDMHMKMQLTFLEKKAQGMCFLKEKYLRIRRRMRSQEIAQTKLLSKQKSRVRELRQSYRVYQEWRQQRFPTRFSDGEETKPDIKKSSHIDVEDERYEFLEREPIHDPINTGKGEHVKGKSYTSLNLSRRQSKSHKRKHTISCDECGKTFVHCSSLSRHKKVHKLPQAALNCKYCSKQMYRRDQFAKHNCKERRMSCDYWKAVQ